MKISKQLLFVIGMLAYKAILLNLYIYPWPGFALKALVTFCYLGALLYAVKKAFLRKYPLIYTILYTLISVMMLIDLIYLKYTNQFTSIGILNQADQALSVLDSVKSLFSMKYLLLILDVPVVAILLYNVYRAPMGFRKQNHWNYVKAALILLLPLLILINPVNSEVIEGLKGGEFFSYHIYDVKQVLFGSKSLKPKLQHSLMNFGNRNQKSEFFGSAEGRNLIVIQVESLQNFVINKTYEQQELTPNLNKLIKEQGSLYFNNYYQMLGRGNTSDAEFVSNNSLYPMIYGQAYTEYVNNDFYGLPWILKDKGYSTVALHGYKKEFWNRDNAYVGQGFDKFISEQDYEVSDKIGLGITDKDFFEQSIGYLKNQKQPFYSFMISLSSHTPYDFPEQHRTLIANENHKGSDFEKYLNAIHYTDNALGVFIDKLKEAGLYENSVIAIYGDHFGLLAKDTKTNKLMSDFLGYSYDYDEMLKVPLIIHIPGQQMSKSIEVVGSQLDFAPTILNLMGIRKDPFIMMGQDLVNAEHGFVATQTQMLKGSYIQDDIVFEISRDGIYNNSKAWNKKTRAAVDITDCRAGYERAIAEIDQSIYILENNMIKELMKNNKTLKAADLKKGFVTPPELIAHAGGQLDEYTYINNKEALDYNYEQGFRLFEVDFEWTSDDKPVILHSWDGYIEKFFNEKRGVYAYEEFMNFKMINNWQQLDINRLEEWLKSHPDAFVVTDVKNKNLELLEYISKNHKDIQGQIIPQIYHMEEYVKVEYMGYKNIIYTLYLSKNTDEEIIDFVKRNKLFAVTMSIYKAQTELLKKLDATDTFIYVHTINSPVTQRDLKEKGVDGFYTDIFKSK